MRNLILIYLSVKYFKITFLFLNFAYTVDP